MIERYPLTLLSAQGGFSPLQFFVALGAYLVLEPTTCSASPTRSPAA